MSNWLDLIAGVQELSSRQVLRHWSWAAHLQRTRLETGRLLQQKTVTAVLGGALKDWRTWRVASRVMRRMYEADPFACWRERVAEKAVAKRLLLQATQTIMFGGLGRAFHAWHQDAEVGAVEDAYLTLAFACKQSLCR
jgi:hypothetical protein